MSGAHPRAASAFGAAAEAYERGRPGWPVAALDPQRRERALAAVGDVLRRHGVIDLEIAYRTEILTLQGAGGAGPLA